MWHVILVSCCLSIPISSGVHFKTEISLKCSCWCWCSTVQICHLIPSLWCSQPGFVLKRGCMLIIHGMPSPALKTSATIIIIESSDQSSLCFSAPVCTCISKRCHCAQKFYDRVVMQVNNCFIEIVVVDLLSCRPLHLPLFSFTLSSLSVSFCFSTCPRHSFWSRSVCRWYQSQTLSLLCVTPLTILCTTRRWGPDARVFDLLLR